MRTSRPAKHTSYYELLEAILEADACPLCKLEIRSVERYLSFLLHESVNDGTVREALIGSGGFCPRHAGFLGRTGSAFGIAVLYHDQVSLRLQSLDELLLALKRNGRRRVSRPSRSHGCPACCVQLESRQRFITVLLEWAEEPELQDALAAGCGFCFPHFLKVREASSDAGTAKRLIEIQQTKMRALLLELEDFQRKHDYRFSGEGFGRESDSWLRAIRAVVGEDGVF